jgi:toxin ParE1/3/4
MKVVWSKESITKLLEIETFIAEDSPARAGEFIDFILSQARLIEENPKIGRVVPEFSNPVIRELIIKNYRLVYRIHVENIVILTVFEGHRLIRRSEIFLGSND